MNIKAILAIPLSIVLYYTASFIEFIFLAIHCHFILWFTNPLIVFTWMLEDWCGVGFVWEIEEVEWEWEDL